MADERPVEPTRTTAGAAFLVGAGRGFLICAFVLVMVVSMFLPETMDVGFVARGVGFVAASMLVGGLRSMWLSCHTRWAPRIAIGTVTGALLGAIVGTGVMVMIGGPGAEPPIEWVGWCAGCFALVLGLRPLQYELG